MAVSLVVAGLLAGFAIPAAAAGPAADASASAHTQATKAKKKKKKCKGKKCKKKAPPAQSPAPPAAGGAPPTPPPPNQLSSEELIDAAVARGDITSETGLTYKVFAAFGDPRLPAQYAGVAAGFGHAPLDEVAAGWASLSPGAQAILGPFLIPPFHAGSHWEPGVTGVQSASTLQDAQVADGPDPTQPWCTGTSDIVFQNWSFVEADSGPAAGKVRIWYQNQHSATDLATANVLMTAMEAKIWPSLTTLMGRVPLPDGGSTRICGGGSDAVDIALLDGLATATTYATGLNPQGASARTAFPRIKPANWAGLKPYLAHEFFHMLQYSYTFASGSMTSGSNQWLREGTAQWAQDYVSSSHYGSPLDPTQTEHEALKYYFPEPEKPLDAHDPADKRAYSSYVFWIWAARAGGDPGVVRQAWNALATHSSLEAAKSVFGSGWDQAWKDFAKALWNQDPVTNFRDWDSITDTPAVAAEGTLPSDEITPVLTTVGSVGAKYLTFEPADTLTEVKYRNVGGVDPEAGVQAIISYEDGTKAVEDWSSLTVKDVPACDIESLTLVLSNSSVVANDSRVFSLNWTPAGLGGSGSGAEIRTAAAGVCLPPAGTFNGTAHYTDGAVTELDWNWSGNVVFQPDGQGTPWFPEFFGETWDQAVPQSGSITLSGSGTVTTSEGDCTISVPSQSYTYSPATHGGTILIQPGPQPHYGISLNLPDDAMPQGTLTCPDADPYTGLFPVPAMVFTEEPQQTATRGTYTGSATFSNQLFNSSMNWSFSVP